MAHAFTIQLNEEIGSVLQRVASAIRENGGDFQGDAEQGAFAGRTVLGQIRGEYRRVAGDEISVTILSKPFILPYGTIESEIRQYFG